MMYLEQQAQDWPNLLHDLAEACGAGRAQLWRGADLLADVTCDPTAGVWHEAPLTLGAGLSGQLRLAFGASDLDADAPEVRITRLAARLTARFEIVQAELQRWQQARDASLDMLTINEEEFGRIILDIHDGPVQNMFAALSQVNLLQSQLAQHGAGSHEEDYTELQKRLPRISGLLESSLTEIRNFIGAFRPPEFARRNLQIVVEGLIIQHEELTGSTVNLQVAQSLPIVPLPIKIALYRIVQEALFNAHKHAGVNHHDVRLGMDGGVLCLTVADQGAGFDVATALAAKAETEAGRHIGLRGMGDRVKMVGGSLNIQSAPGQGTRIEVRIPLYESERPIIPF